MMNFTNAMIFYFLFFLPCVILHSQTKTMFRGAKNAMIRITHVILFYPVYFCIVMAGEIEAREALRLML